NRRVRTHFNLQVNLAVLTSSTYRELTNVIPSQNSHKSVKPRWLVWSGKRPVLSKVTREDFNMKVFAVLLICSQVVFPQILLLPSTENGRSEFAIEALEASKLDPGAVNALIYDSTFLLFGKKTLGTGFVLAANGGSQNTKHKEFFLVTANHVLN